ncbi:uncharacterized protein KY384_005297 [Bacidia gigantensis]|uniref:uncharacterized protein n=1 Tax=Bacidia gigantensis TaxID=2732470 RepID=UPI001D05235D|nr:uncharacterized protein KY384_005297 [Bacidia gigantensis]KAG8529816.1 hypothetical protein KY384_005297 [Bacidia gigantensis]
MALHALAIARASFTASMTKPDPTSLSRSDTISFLDSLEGMLRLCSTQNVQNVLPSGNRLPTLGKYMLARSESIEKTTEGNDDGTSISPSCSPQRMQIHLLYLIHDLFHHAEFHSEEYAAAPLSAKLQFYLKSIVKSASGPVRSEGSLHQQRLQQLLGFWREEGFFDYPAIQELHEIATKGGQGNRTSKDESKVANGNLEDDRSAPYIMPAAHGDGSIAFYDLPASNMMPHIAPNSTRPIKSNLVKPLQLVSGAADKYLATAVESFLQEIDSLDNIRLEEQRQQKIDVDQLGQLTVLDDTNASTSRAEGYYGWSRGFCQMIKRVPTHPFPFRTDGLGVPPRPPNYGGLWPPPPPPPPPPQH